jgi:exopolyphosphatase / guanosine-5'-triphosphate,3'-diphosphate pyrophosphatase
LSSGTPETRRDKILAAGRAGIVDIGSNSVRLVIYDGPQRAPSPDFNEKALCAIGRGIASTGRLDEEGVETAIQALARFRLIAEARGVKRVEAVATAAVREARNGPEFLARARHALGVDVRMLTGELEAHLAAEGVAGGIPDADGLVGDLGGGSLEITPIQNLKIAPGLSFPFGPLRLMDASGGRIDKARQIVDQGLEAMRGQDNFRGKALYAVGGVWRSIAKIHMDSSRYPVKVLHAYSIERDDAIKHLEHLASRSKKAMDEILREGKKRAETIPFGAVVMERVLKAFRLDRVVISAYGVREGLLFQRLPEEVKRQDPLLAALRDMAAREARDPHFEDVLTHWTQNLFPQEDATSARLRRAACILWDVAWRGHPDHRAEDMFRQVLHGNFTAIDHHGRAFLAMAAFYRYADQEETTPEYGKISAFLGETACGRARALGAALRLAYAIAGASPDIIKSTSLRVTPAQVILTLPKALDALWCDAVDRKFSDLATALERTKRFELK